MNKKTFFWVCVVLILIIGLIIWLLLKGRPSSDLPSVPADDSCLILQSENPSRPCYSAPRPPAPTSSSTQSAVSECSEGSVFEKNDCILKTVQKNGDIGLCLAIQGPVAKAACLNQRKDSVVSEAFKPTANTYEAYVRSYVASAPQEASISPSPQTVTSLRQLQESTFSKEDIAAVTIEGFHSRMADKARLATFTVLPYQSRPGDTVKIQGMGFALTPTNVAHIAGTEVSGLASTDGMSLSVVVPSSASMGSNEVWVTNARGSSRNPEMPIYAVVSQNPVPPPKITGFSPQNPKYTDTITLSGDNLNGIKAVSTSLGMVLSGSLSFKPADLEYAHLVLDQPSVKGSVFPMQVFVFADGGLSEKPFTINVQF